MSNTRLLADFVRAGGPYTKSRDASDQPGHRPAFGGLAAYIERLPEDDPRLIQMGHAGYFATGAFVPGPQARDWLAELDPDEDYGGVADMLVKSLAGSALIDTEHPDGFDWDAAMETGVYPSLRPGSRQSRT